MKYFRYQIISGRMPFYLWWLFVDGWTMWRKSTPWW